MERCQDTVRQMEHYAQPKMGTFVRLLWQLIANLADANSKKHVLEGNVVNELDLIQGTGDAVLDPQTLVMVDLYRMFACFWFKEYAEMIKIIEATGTQQFSYEKKQPGALFVGPLYCYCAVACLVHARKTRKSKYKRYGLGFYNKIKSWMKKGNPNYRHYEAMIQAELDSLNKKFYDASKNYQVAILLAEERGLKGDEALFREHYAQLLEEAAVEGVVLHEEASSHYQKANLLYSEWGAMCKVDMLPSTSNNFGGPVPVVGVSD